MKVVFVFLTVVGAALTQVPVPCTSPLQWEARERVMQVDTNFEEWHRIFYDGNLGRERNRAEVEVGSTKEFFDVLTLYNENKRYSLNMKTRQCNVTQINRPFRHRGVPPDAKFVSVFTAGATGVPGEYITVQTFEANVTFGTFHEEYFGLATYPDCGPVQNWYYNAQEKTKDLVSYYGVTIGISDPMVFVPPSECLKQ